MEMCICFYPCLLYTILIQSTYFDEPVGENSMRFVDFCLQRMDILFEVTNVLGIVLLTDCTWLKMVHFNLLRVRAKVWCFLTLYFFKDNFVNWVEISTLMCIFLR